MVLITARAFSGGTSSSAAQPLLVTWQTRTPRVHRASVLSSASMTPRDVESATAPRPDLNSPEALQAATERLRALGIDDDVVFSCTSADDLAAHLGTERIARS